MKTETCQLCGFNGNLQKHHLIPQSRCRKKYEKFKEDPNNHIYICDMCHRTIHAYFSESELEISLNSLKSLKFNEKFSSYLRWRKKHMNFNSNSTKMSKDIKR